MGCRRPFCQAIVLISLQTRLFLPPDTGRPVDSPERQRQSPVVNRAEMYKLVVTLLCVLLAVASAQKAAQQPQQAEKKKSPLVGNFGPNGQRLGLASAPMRHRYHYDAMHINGKPFVTCNHPAFKFGCAHMTYPRTFMNQHHKLIMGAQIEHKNEPTSHVAKDAFLQFAMQQGWSVKRSAYRGKPLGYKGPGMK